MKRTESRRKKPLRAKKPMRKISLNDVRKAWGSLLGVNKKRKLRLRSEQFGPDGFSDFIRESGCVVARASRTDEGCLGPIQHCHRKSRGSGGKWCDNSFGACLSHHNEEHTIGQQTFERRHGLDLDLECCALTNQWDVRTLNKESK